jgi:hypothetical protein
MFEGEKETRTYIDLSHRSVGLLVQDWYMPPQVELL